MCRHEGSAFRICLNLIISTTMNRLTSRDGRDYLSGLPIELIELIFKFCADDCRGEPYRTFVQFQFLPGKTSYFEYTGEMRRGLPNGYGTLYHGSTRWDFIPERMPRGADFRQTIWMFQPLLYVFPDQARLLCAGPVSTPNLGAIRN